MSWYDTLTSAPVLLAGALGISAAIYAKRGHTSGQAVEQVKEVAHATRAEGTAGKMAQAGVSIMSPPPDNLPAPKSDPITPSDLANYNGTDPSKPIYVAIKGRVFDVSAKKDMYGKGAGYNVFAGKDASKGLGMSQVQSKLIGLGMSSLKPEDAIPDYSTLNEQQRTTLDQWESFFEKRYAIIGSVGK